MDEDPEALVERRLARDPEDAGELVLQRAGPVGLDVRGADSSRPSPRRGRKGSSDGSSRAASAAARARASCSARSRTSSSGEVWRISRCCGGRRVQDRGVDPGQRVGEPLALGAVHERRELDELEVAHDAVGDVEVGVEPQLAQARADPRERRAGGRRAARRRPRGASRRGRRAPPRGRPTRRRAPPAPPRRTGTGAARRRVSAWAA